MGVIQAMWWMDETCTLVYDNSSSLSTQTSFNNSERNTGCRTNSEPGNCAMAGLSSLTCEELSCNWKPWTHLKWSVGIPNLTISRINNAGGPPCDQVWWTASGCNNWPWILRHNLSKSECFQVQPVTCYDLLGFLLLIWGIFHTFL